MILPAFAVLALAACAAPPQSKFATPGPLQPANFTPAPEATSPLPGPASPLPANHAPSDLAHGPDRFEGLTGVDVIAALGDPSFRRRESPAEVWQYYGPGCILDLFLYDDGPNAAAGATVTHAELRGREGAQPEAACLSRLIDLRHRQRAG
jgi:hypothetical protein